MPGGGPLCLRAGGPEAREDPRDLPGVRASRGRPAILFLSCQHADPDQPRARQDLPQPDAEPDHRPRRLVGGRWPVPPSRNARERPRRAARAKPLSVHEAASRALRRAHARGASRSDGRGRERALLGRARRALLRHDVSGSRRVQRGPRHPLHRRPDAQDADLRRPARRQRQGGDGPAASERPRGAAHARSRGLHASTATSTFSTAARR